MALVSGAPAAIHLRGLQSGAVASSALVENCDGTVAATFDRSAYLRSADGHFVCLLPPEMPGGPLHLRVDQPASAWVRALNRGQPYRIVWGELRSGELAIDLRNTEVWDERLRTGFVQPKEHDVHAMWMAQLKGYGDRSEPLAAVLGSKTHWPHSATTALDTLRDWVAGRTDSCAPHALDALVGLGHGLTPAGDDLLAGTALGLRAHASEKLADFSLMVRVRLEHTHPISAAHLGAALDGQVSAPALVAVTSLAAGDRARLEDACNQLGQSSGWDMLAGLLLVEQANYLRC